jgi:hypothetical protein
LSDECNDECSREILDGLALKASSWIIGLLAVVANSITCGFSMYSFKKCRTTVALTNKFLIAMISFGDMLVGLYLLTVSVYDNAVYGRNYCTNQTSWLSKNECITLGITSTIGSQVSLFAMTVLSLIRVHGIWNSMRVPGEVTFKSILRIMAMSFIIFACSGMIGVVPILHQAEDFFINGLQYDHRLRLFISSVSKEAHFKVFREYFGRMTYRSLSWDLTRAMVSEMFSHDDQLLHALKDFTKTHKRVEFYGNDGVCLFKYFIRNADPQRSFVFGILVLNFTCFVAISVCYIIISVLSMKSSNMVTSGDDEQTRKRNSRMNQKISMIILTDFLCWVPFIVICSLHYLEALNANKWYSLFSMVILPINSVINPFLYEDVIKREVGKRLSQVRTRLTDLSISVRSRISVSSHRSSVRLQNIQMHEI